MGQSFRVRGPGGLVGCKTVWTGTCCPVAGEPSMLYSTHCALQGSVYILATGPARMTVSQRSSCRKRGGVWSFNAAHSRRSVELRSHTAPNHGQGTRPECYLRLHVHSRLFPVAQSVNSIQLEPYSQVSAVSQSEERCCGGRYGVLEHTLHESSRMAMVRTEKVVQNIISQTVRVLGWSGQTHSRSL